MTCGFIPSVTDDRPVLIAERTVVGKDRHWLNVYLCRCGNTFYARRSYIETGNTTSCGCYRAKKRTKHGQSNTPEYRIWISMKGRCYSRKHSAYSYYGALGIRVHDRWKHSFEDFIADMGKRPSPRHTIDRIDVFGNYEPGNCRWATPKQQSYNKRNTRKYIYKGSEYTLWELKDMFGGDKSRLIDSRLQRGWSIERIMSTPKLESGVLHAKAE